MEAAFEVRTEKALVRIHGTVDQEKLKEAATIFLKKCEYQKRIKKEGK